MSLPAVVQHVGLGDQRGGAEAVGRDGALDDGRSQLGLGEVGCRFLGEHGAQQFLASGNVGTLGGNDEGLAGSGAHAGLGDLRAGGDNRNRSTCHLEVSLGLVLHLVLDPGT